MLTPEEILRFIEEDTSSTKKQKAQEGQNYYEGKHDILNYKLYYYNTDGELVPDETRSNIKIPHPFFTELQDQLVQYMLSGEGPFIKSDTEGLQPLLDEYFNDNDDFIAELQEVLNGAGTKGFEYMYAYRNKEGKLAFQCADSLGVIEAEAKYTSDHRDYVIYWYTERINKDKELVKRIQVWDDAQTWYFTQTGDGKIELDPHSPESPNPRPHVLYKKTNDDNTYYEGLGFIPFFRLDNNKKQHNNLKPIKALIDDYDLMACGLSNNLQDASEYVLVVKGYEGENDLSKLQTNIKTKKVVSVGEGGDFDFKTVSIPHDARKIKLELDEKNIYRFGMGFNSSQIGDGNITNIVIKSRYALLDLKSNKLEIRLKQFLKKIIKVVIEEINKENNTAYQIKDVYFDFEREIMTNASDNATIAKTEAEIEQIRINTFLTLATIIGDEEVLKLICEVLDIDYEEIKDKVPDNEGLDDFNNLEDLDEQVAI